MDKMRFYFSVCLALGTSSLGLTLPQSPAQKVTDYPTSGVKLGNGWFSPTGEKTNSICIEFQAQHDSSQSKSFNFTRVLDREDYSKELGVSVAFQAKSILGASASGKASYAQSVKMSSENLNMSLLARVMQGADYVAPVSGSQPIRLTKDALALLKKSVTSFYMQCGDGYVASIYRGGEVVGFMSFNNSSSDNKTAMAASLEGTYGGFSGSASFTQVVHDFKSTRTMNLSVSAKGGSGGALAVDEDQLMAMVSDLPNAVAKAPYPYSVGIASYQNLSNWPSDKIIRVSINKLDDLINQYQKFETLYFDLAQIIAREDDYIFARKSPTRDTVRALQDQLRTIQLPQLKNAISDCFYNSNCTIPAQANISDYEIRMKFPVHSLSFETDRRLSVLNHEREDLRSNDPSSHRIEEISQQMNGLFSTYLRDEAEAIFKQWIQDPNRVRCERDATSSYCLSQAELQQYRARIIDYVRD